MNKTYAAGLAAFTEPKTRSNSVFLSKFLFTFIFVLYYVLSYGQCVDPNLMSFSGNAPNSPTEICIGTEVTFTITGDLNGADRWVVFRGSCGGTIVGESTTNIITFTLEETNTYFVAGIDGCVSTPSCLNISFTVVDNTLPTALCQNITVFLDGSGNAVIDSNAVDNGSSDNCDIDRFELNQATFDCIDVSNSPITLTQTVFDASGNFSSCTANATVRDTVSPVAICQDITVFLDGAGNASIVSGDIDNGSSDACSIGNLSANPTSFNCSNLVFNTSTLTVTDVNNNSSMCTANVTVRDTVSPVARCQDITVFLDGSGSAVIDSNAVDNGSSDNCDIDRFVLNQATFHCIDVSNSPITVTQTVFDASGNEALCNANVTVADTTSPSITCLSPAPVDVTSDQCEADVTVPIPSTGDNCSVSTLTNDYNNLESANDTYPTGSTVVVWTVTDVSGNSTNCSVTVVVGPDTDGDGTCDFSDMDDDNDGVDDDNDPAPLNPSICGDMDGDGCDDCSATSPTDFTPGSNMDIANDGTDTDGDGQCDAGDSDDDNDGVPDENDTNPLDEFVCSDVDQDGCDDCSSGTFNPDNDGTDTDGDGICDLGDSCINFPGQIGDPCDDGNQFTEGDIINGNCECVGPIEIPTLSQWSILFLCLTMVIFGVVVVKFSLPEHLKEYFYE